MRSGAKAKEMTPRFLKKGEFFPLLIQDPTEPRYTIVSSAKDLEVLRLFYQDRAAENRAHGYEGMAEMYDKAAERCLDLERRLGKNAVVGMAADNLGR